MPLPSPGPPHSTVGMIGWTVREGTALHLAGVTGAQSSTWRASGLDVGRVRESLRLGLPATVAAAWRDAGWTLAAAAEAVVDGLRLSGARGLRAEGVRRQDVLPRLRAGVDAASVQRWIASGHELAELVFRARDDMPLADLTWV